MTRGDKSAAGWTTIDRPEYDTIWDRFEAQFRFRPDPSGLGPSIDDPTPSVTFRLEWPAGPQHSAAQAAINAEVLRAIVWALPDNPEMLALDWQHLSYRWRPAQQVLNDLADWPITPYPDGDYHALLTEDFRHGTFGHPWERTLCVFGQPLIDSLGASLATWLPVIRHNGQPV